MSKPQRQRLTEANASTSKADRVLASCMLAELTSVPFETAASLATRVSVSEPTVGRFCRVLGYTSFKRFKALLAAGFLSTGALVQEASIAFSSGELGATSHNPVTSSNLNSATWLIHDRLVQQDAEQSYHLHLATSWEEAVDGHS
jgi:DNA-binding MurR/RpiR family transcriptional regulator